MCVSLRRYDFVLKVIKNGRCGHTKRVCHLKRRTRVPENVVNLRVT